MAWVWSPNVPDVGGVGYQSYYPGDNYVDWIGVSLYSGNDPTAMDDIYQKYAAKKPFFITEWATSPSKNQYNPGFPGEVAWVKEFFEALNARYPAREGDFVVQLESGATAIIVCSACPNKPKPTRATWLHRATSIAPEIWSPTTRAQPRRASTCQAPKWFCATSRPQ